MTDPLPLTGERTMPGVPAENYWYRRHEAAYRAVAGMLPAGPVLEVGVGEGYGTALLGQPVLGVDYDAVAAAHAARRYPRLTVLRGNAVALPVAGGSMAAVVSMQVLEHLWDQPRHLAECRRVLRTGGMLVVSTPNRLTFSPGYDPATDRPRNIYHSREYAAAELSELVGRTVGNHTVYGLHAGARLRELDRRCRAAWRLDLVEAQLARPADEWPPELAAMVASVRADDFELHTADPDAALDLIVLSTPT